MKLITSKYIKSIRKFYWAFVIIFAVFVNSCRNNQTEEKPQPKAKEIEASLIFANKQSLKTEEQQIQDLIERYNWRVSETGTGLKYLIYKNGDGKKVEEGDRVTLDYSVTLLNGMQIYSSNESGPKQFLVGKGGVESGLEEGILLLNEGDRAKLILPSHLAFGLTGDQDKIPPKTTIIYDVHLLKIQ
jgi:FKBP-type peptidyl-prolyl cis-trans isomerase FkpA